MTAAVTLSPIDDALSALADPARRQTVELLRRGPLSAGSLAEALGLSRPMMSRHLRTLREAGLVESSLLPSDTRVREYRLLPRPLMKLRDWLEGFDAHWGTQLAAFKAHAERKGNKRD